VFFAAQRQKSGRFFEIKQCKS